ncbi:MAG: hypothetical protein FWB81_02165 [Cystobacterineae bacterium]|nr:hypothetical protein [Cystobacterineae bacterium]
MVAHWLQFAPVKPVAHWLQLAPVKPVLQEQLPAELQLPWPLHVVDA